MMNELHPNSHEQLLTADNPMQAATNVIPNERWEPGQEGIYATDPVIGPVYGNRIEAGQVERCSLEDMVTINQVIKSEVLRDEEGHAPLLTETPYPNARITASDFDPDPEEDNKAFANNDAWLIHIRNGYWPIPKGAYGYSEHDYSDTHLAVMALAPRELQEQITYAAHHELTRRLERTTYKPGTPGVDPEVERYADPIPTKALILPGESSHESDPLAYTRRGEAIRGELDGIDVIDQATDEPSLLSLLSDLAQLPTDEDREAAMQTYTQLASLSNEERRQAIEARAQELGLEESEAPRWISDQEQLANAAYMQRRVIVGVTNFNVRHAEKRNMTETEQSQVAQNYLAGIVRVANKLHNNYPGRQ